jgi:hypothetical protein
MKMKVFSLRRNRVGGSREKAAGSCQGRKGKGNRSIAKCGMKSVTECQHVRKIFPELSNFTHLPGY